MIYVVGLGPGSKEYILPKAVETLENSDMLVGFSRALESVNFINTERVAVKSLSDILK
ncbi:MAG TPA: precorrin-6y C5,15-methyltransferase (decarboxylating) subunit CbiE, partial [Clostridium sp.]|nr:precorrin-6y C5,15-methyltransferase (decarboxylating) subunit CbiE [Clostridium sp.]